VLVLIVDLSCAGFRGLMKDVVKVRMNQAGLVMIVVAAGMDMLEWRQAKSLHQSKTDL
jgi:hypothetical protein